jgi:hypothetical protein
MVLQNRPCGSTLEDENLLLAGDPVNYNISNSTAIRQGIGVVAQIVSCLTPASFPALTGLIDP